MKFVRALFLIGARCQIEYSAQHIPGLLNMRADALSRLRIRQEFRTLCPEANTRMTAPERLIYEGLINFVKIPTVRMGTDLG